MDRKWKFRIAGILNIVAGLIYILLPVYLLTIIPLPHPTAPSGISATFIRLGWIVPYTVVGALTIAGGICALLGKLWGLAFTSAIFGLLFLLGLPAGIFLVLVRDDWSRLHRGIVFGVLSFLTVIAIGIYVLAQLL